MARAPRGLVGLVASAALAVGCADGPGGAGGPFAPGPSFGDGSGFETSEAGSDGADGEDGGALDPEEDAAEPAADGVVEPTSEPEPVSVAPPPGCAEAGDGEGVGCVPASAVAFCVSLGAGVGCDGDLLVACVAGAVSTVSECLHGCLAVPGGAVCGPGGADTFCALAGDGIHCHAGDLTHCAGGLAVEVTPCPAGCDELDGAAADVCTEGVGSGEGFCTPVPPKASPSPPTGACDWMDWEMSPDGFYVLSQFGTTADPTTLGNPTSCGYLQGFYDQHGCLFDGGAGACVGGSPEIPWVEGHVDWPEAEVMADAALASGGSPSSFYVADAQRFGCGAVLRVSHPETGVCVVVYAEDGGPGAKYESAPYAGRRILDASPAIPARLGAKGIGWKSGDLVYVEWGLPGDVPGDSCSPCSSEPALAGSEGSKPPWDLLHMVPACGDAAPEDGGDPAPSPASCPSGDGLYCGTGGGLDPATLYLCSGGTWSPHEACANGCEVMPPGTSDACAAGPSGADECPAGDGLYCGGPQGLDAKTLYYCSGGSFSPVQSCAETCQVNPPGVSDACSGGAGGSGALVLCNPFEPPKGVTCGFGCYGGHMGSDFSTAEGTPVYAPLAGLVTKASNEVKTQTCSPDFGTYVKIQQGVYEVILAHLDPTLLVGKGDSVAAGTLVGEVSNTGYTLTLKNGAWVCGQGGGFHLHLEVRKNGVPFDPYASEDVVWTDCDAAAAPDPPPSGGDTFCEGKQNGLWCKGADLANCQGGKVAATTPCPYGCTSMPVGVADECAEPPKPPASSCPSGDGLYCGSTPGAPGGLDAGDLYQCTSGTWTKAQDCANGCEVMPPGQPDQCKAPPSASCPSGDGLYCGSAGGKDPSTLYLCQGGGWTFQAWCSSGCHVAPPGQPDSCNAGSCPFGNGLYCGETGGLDPNTLYQCTNGAWSVQQACGGKCVVAPPGVPDHCP